ncbi:acetylxylan esterase [Mucilaginibacter hurinus]|nr:acetylxylan esterase [Mucilaginibacter hurinus]
MVGSICYATHRDGGSEKEFLFSIHPSKKNAIFKTGDNIRYDVKVTNPFNIVQEGTISYQVTTQNNIEVASKSIKVSIGKRSSGSYSLPVPFQKDPGFYKISVKINVTEYDDTLKRVFGVNPQQIISDNQPPADFEKYWLSARADLRKVAPQFKMTEQSAMRRGEQEVYLIEAQSLNNVTVRGWLTITTKRKPGQKLPVWLVFPGYGIRGYEPIYGPPGLAVITFNLRGQGNSRDQVRPTTDGYLTTDIEHKERYILRGAIMDCVRAVDFICSRPELDSTNIICSGESMGGYYSLITSCLDKRVKFCSAYNPTFADWRALQERGSWPMSALLTYSKDRFIPISRMLTTLDYFDLKNFTPKLDARTLIAISLLDNLAPPYNQYTMINNIKAPYKVLVYPDLAHEVPQSSYEYLSGWMMDEFGMF